MRSDESEQEIGKYKNEVNEIKQQLIRLTNDYQTDKKSVKVAASVLAMCLVGFFGFTYYQIGEKIDKALDVIIIQNAKTKAIEAQELAQNASDNSVRFLQQIKDIHTSITRYASEIEKIHDIYKPQLEKINELESRIKMVEGEQSAPSFTIFTAGDSSKQDIVTTAPDEWQEFSDLKVTFTLKRPTVVLAFYQVTMAALETIGYLSTRLVIDGEDVPHTRSITGNTIFWSPSNVWVGELKEGSHTLSVQYRVDQNGVSDTTNDWENRILKVLVFGHGLSP